MRSSRARQNAAALLENLTTKLTSTSPMIEKKKKKTLKKVKTN